MGALFKRHCLVLFTGLFVFVGAAPAAKVTGMKVERFGDLFDVEFTILIESDIEKFTAIADRVDWLPFLTPMVERAYYLNSDETEVLMDLRTCVLWKCWFLTKISTVERGQNSIDMHHSELVDSFIVADEYIHYEGSKDETLLSYRGRLLHKYKVPTWINTGLIAAAAKFEIGRGAKRLERALNGEEGILGTPF